MIVIASQYNTIQFNTIAKTILFIIRITNRKTSLDLNVVSENFKVFSEFEL